MCVNNTRGARPIGCFYNPDSPAPAKILAGPSLASTLRPTSRVGVGRVCGASAACVEATPS